MNTPIPTPFDITPLAPAPLVPSLYAWLLLLSTTAIAFLVARRLGHPRSHTSVDDLLRALALDLRNLAERTTQADLERIARIARRIAALYSTEAIYGLSAAEIRSVSETMRSSGDAPTHSVASIIAVIAEIEDRLYAPPTEHQSRELLDLAQKLSSMIDEHVRRYPLA